MRYFHRDLIFVYKTIIDTPNKFILPQVTVHPLKEVSFSSSVCHRYSLELRESDINHSYVNIHLCIRIRRPIGRYS